MGLHLHNMASKQEEKGKEKMRYMVREKEGIIRGAQGTHSSFQLTSSELLKPETV